MCAAASQPQAHLPRASRVELGKAHAQLDVRVRPTLPAAAAPAAPAAPSPAAAPAKEHFERVEAAAKGPAATAAAAVGERLLATVVVKNAAVL